MVADFTWQYRPCDMISLHIFTVDGFLTGSGHVIFCASMVPGPA